MTNTRFIINVYPTERRMSDNPFSVVYKKATEYRVTDQKTGIVTSFWSMKLANQAIKSIVESDTTRLIKNRA